MNEKKDNSIESISNSFNLILEESKKYVPASETNMIIGSYGILMASITPKYGINNPFIYQSLENALYLTHLGIRSEFISCSLLFFPYIWDKIQNLVFLKQYTDLILTYLDSLFTLSKYFEYDLPWFNEVIGNEIKITPKSNSANEYWEKKNIQQFATAFLAIAQKPELAIIKLVNREYLLKNIEKFPITKENYETIARQTFTIYSPVAEMLGIWHLKSQLEDHSFKILYPREYKSIANDLQEKLVERKERINRAIAKVYEVLNMESVSAIINGRPKHLYGLFQKNLKTGKTISEINDSLAIRIIVTKVEDCYITLSLLDYHFGMVEGIYEKGKKYRDWIETPKPNQYQSIHTTILFEDKLIEVQIRTQEMHDIAEYGIAAHWLYKKKGLSFNQNRKYSDFIDYISSLRKQYENQD